MEFATHLPTEEVEVEGHIIDSLILPKILDSIMLAGGNFQIRQVTIGQTRNDPSYALLAVQAPTQARLREILNTIADHGATPVVDRDCRLVEADMDGAFPEGFYSTTNQRTEVRLQNNWVEVQQQEMDCGIAVDAHQRHRMLRTNERSCRRSAVCRRPRWCPRISRTAIRIDPIL